MKTKIIFLLLLLTNITVAQTHLWTKQVNRWAVPFHVTSDNAGNVFTAGYFSDTVDFDPGSGVTKLSSTAPSAYVTKLDANGNFLWVANVEGAPGTNNSNSLYDLTTDPFGNVYVCGFFSGTCDFDPGPGTYTLTQVLPSQVPGNTFIWKLTANGSLVWVKQISSAGISINSHKADLNGNFYVAGSFSGTQDLDWGPGTSNYTSIGQKDCFVAKLDPAGNLIHAKQFGYSGESSALKEISIDASPNVNLIGTFTSSIDADPGPGSFILNANGGSYQYFNIKLDAAGNFISAATIPGHSANMSMYNVSNDKLGNVYISGQFSGVYDFDPSSLTHTLQATSNSAFICKLNSSGNFLWVKAIDLQQGLLRRALHDGGGNVFLVGESTIGIVDCDPGPGTNTVAPGNFISILNSSGNFVSAIALTSFGGPSDFDTDNAGNIYITSYFPGNPNNLSSTFTTSKYGSVFTGIKPQTTDLVQAVVFPNPGNGDFILKTQSPSDIYTLEVYNQFGQKLQEQAVNSESTSIDLKNQGRGIYFLRISDKGINVWQTKLIKE